MDKINFNKLIWFTGNKIIIIIIIFFLVVFQ